MKKPLTEKETKSPERGLSDIRGTSDKEVSVKDGTDEKIGTVDRV